MPATTYEYEMQTICTADGKSKSSFTAIQTFTTSASRMEDMASAISVNVYPNPASDKLMVNIENATGAVVLLVQNTIGQIVLQKTVSSGVNELPVSSLPAGIYFLHVTSNGSETTEKFVKE